MRKRDSQFNLIPYGFKFVGLVISALAALFIIGVKEAWYGLKAEHVEQAKTYGLNLFILGLLFIALAKDKIEDERTFASKTKAFAGGFVGAIIYAAMVDPFMKVVLKSQLPELTGQGLALLMLFVYLFTYYIQKFTGEEA